MANLPAFMDKLSALKVSAHAAAGLGSDMPPRLSIAENKFTLIDAAGNTRLAGQLDPKLGLYLEVQFVDVNENVSKMYREEDNFDKDNPLPPTCWSDDGKTPSATVTKQQAPACLTCPKNERGSAISKQSGVAIKACRDQKQAAFLHNGGLYQFVVTPGSMKTWKQYLRTLEGHGVDLIQVITRIHFVGQGELDFAPVRAINEGEVDAVCKVREEKASDYVVGRSLVSAPTPMSPMYKPEPPPTQAQVLSNMPAQYNQAQAPLPPPPSVAREVGERAVAQAVEKRRRGRPAKVAQEPLFPETVVGTGPIPTDTPFPSNPANNLRMPSIVHGIVEEDPSTPSDDELQNAMDRAFNLPL